MTFGALAEISSFARMICVEPMGDAEGGQSHRATDHAQTAGLGDHGS